MNILDLREFRKGKGYQRQFIATNVGICGKHLNDVEAGRVNLTKKVALKLSEVYKVNISKVIDMYMEGRTRYEKGRGN